MTTIRVVIDSPLYPPAGTEFEAEYHDDPVSDGGRSTWVWWCPSIAEHTHIFTADEVEVVQ